MLQKVTSKFAPAKINLCLHVTGQRGTGYHELDSLVCFSDKTAADKITISGADNLSQIFLLQTSGPFAKKLGDPSNNLVNKALLAYAQELKKTDQEFSHLKVQLRKNLPVASGIGGGSTDAASALKLANEFWPALPENQLFTLALNLGTDVPMCLNDNPKRVQGIGEEILPFNIKCKLPLLLVNSGVFVSTANVFNALKIKNNLPIPLNDADQFNNIDDVINLLNATRNDLQDAAITVAPEIALVLGEIRKLPGCLMTRMSGSGGTCFGIFENIVAAKEAERQLKSHHPKWWTAPLNTVASGNLT